MVRVIYGPVSGSPSLEILLTIIVHSMFCWPAVGNNVELETMLSGVI